MPTEKEQFFALAREMQVAARRLMVCGMHVHIGIDDDDLRVDLMNQLSYFVPHLLALSCSSPFWEGERTGLMSFRCTLFSSLPRTGLPDRFASYADLRRHLDMLIRNGVIENTTKMWWDVRPSPRYPTLEMRVMDCCTSIDDAMRSSCAWRGGCTACGRRTRAGASIRMCSSPRIAGAPCATASMRSSSISRAASWCLLPSLPMS